MKFRNFASVINYYQPLAAFIQSGMFFTGDCADLKFFLALQSADDGTYTPTHILPHTLGQVSGLRVIQRRVHHMCVRFPVVFVHGFSLQICTSVRGFSLSYSGDSYAPAVYLSPFGTL